MFPTYNGDGATTQFAVTFPYLARSHVKVLVDGVAATFTWVGDSAIQIAPAPASGQSVRIVRETPVNPAEVNFADGAVLTASALNYADLRLAYRQEEIDARVGAAVEALEASAENVVARGADITGANDSAAAFAGAIAALPAEGGVVRIPAGTYRLDTVPSVGTKSVLFDIAPDAKFTGAGTGEGKFGYMRSNPAQLAVGPYVFSQTKQKSSNSNGGTAAFNVEFVQPADYGTGQAVALYAGAVASLNNPLANTWVANFVHRIEMGALGTHQLLEADVDCFSADAYVKGISLSGAGTANPDKGIELTRVPASNTLWNQAITIDHAQDAIVIGGHAGGRGIVIHTPAGGDAPGVGNTALTMRQFASGSDTVLIQRKSDADTSGSIIRLINAANSANLFILSASGDMLLAGGAEVGALTVRQGLTLPGLTSFPTDAAAAAAGVPVGGLYRNGSVVQVRVT